MYFSTFIVFIWSKNWINFLILEKFLIDVFSRASFFSFKKLAERQNNLNFLTEKEKTPRKNNN